MVASRASILILNKTTFCRHSVFMCFVWISEQTAIISLYSINWLVCITETECVYCAVRTGYLNVIEINLKAFRQLIPNTNSGLWIFLRILILALKEILCRTHKLSLLFCEMATSESEESCRRTVNYLDINTKKSWLISINVYTAVTQVVICWPFGKIIS